MDKKINGFTLTELMFTGVILIILCGVFLIPFFLSSQKSLKMQNNKIYAEQNARLSIGWIMSKVRSAESIVHNRWIGDSQSKKFFYSTNNGTSSLLTLLALSTDIDGSIRKETNILLGTQTVVWNVYQYRLEHKNSELDDELKEDKYEVLNTNDSNPFQGTWTTLSFISSVKVASYIIPYNGINTGLQFEYWDTNGSICSPEDAAYITIKVNTKIGTETPYCEEAFLKTDVFLRRKAQNF